MLGTFAWDARGALLWGTAAADDGRTESPAKRRPKRAPDAPAQKRVKRARGPSSPIGTNLEGLSDWSPNWAFVDAHKRARPFISGTPSRFSDDRPIDTDAHGWPRRLLADQVVRALLFWDLESWPAGEYVVLYDGQGALEYEPQGRVVARGPGRHVVSLDPKRGNFSYVITKSGEGADYLRNVRVIMPGGVCEGSDSAWCDAHQPCEGKARCVPLEEVYEKQIFHPRFLASVQAYGALRFMDWMGTNGSTQRTFGDRPKPQDASFARGVPLEYMVELANRLSQDAWFTMPHAADDDYNRQFARYVKAHLRPELKVYVEYSNEVWNGIFPQAQYAIEQGKKLGFGPSDWDAQWRWYAHRMKQVHAIWSEVFADQRKRLVRVAAGQAENVGVLEAILGYEGVKGRVDAIAIAPYFGHEYGSPEAAARWQDASLDALFEDLKTRAVPRAIEAMRAHAALAKRAKVDLIAYEGGQHLVGVGPAQDNEKLNALFTAANRDPRMKELYLTYLEGWRKASGKLFVHFTNVGLPGKYGRWGALEHLLQSRAEAPKQDALLTFIEKYKRWW